MDFILIEKLGTVIWFLTWFDFYIQRVLNDFKEGQAYLRLYDLAPPPPPSSLFRQQVVSLSQFYWRRTANNFGLTYSWKRISQNSFPNFIYIIPNSWYSVRSYIIPKGIMKTRFEPRVPRMSSWKSNKHNTLDLNSGPLASEASILPLDHQCYCIIFLQSCPCQDPSWGNKSAKPVKVTGKNDSPR